MNLSRFYRVSAIVLIAQVALGLYGAWVVGPDAQVPVHSGVDGSPNG